MSGPLDRRRFLKLASMATASAALGALPAASGRQHGTDGGGLDVIVIGAGMAGLAAARRLQAGKHKVIVLEARERLGGRIWTDHSWSDVPLDLGASWIHGV